MLDVSLSLGCIKPILIKNNFTFIDGNKFINDKVTIEVELDGGGYYNIYFVESSVNSMISSSDLNIYFLFGFLAAKDLIDRNFKI